MSVLIPVVGQSQEDSLHIVHLVHFLSEDKDFHEIRLVTYNKIKNAIENIFKHKNKDVTKREIVFLIFLLCVIHSTLNLHLVNFHLS